jgi:hypothetical protein
MVADIGIKPAAAVTLAEQLLQPNSNGASIITESCHLQLWQWWQQHLIHQQWWQQHQYRVSISSDSSG